MKRVKKNTTPERADKIKPAVYLSALFVAVTAFIVFLPALGNGFLIWDDDTLVTDNLHIRSLGIDSIKWIFTNVGISIWYPATMLSFAADYAVWGLNPKGFHLTNNILHSLNAFFVFMLVYRLVNAGGDERWRGKPAIAAAAATALLFGVHPLRVESVAWIAERKDVLYSFFYLLSILAYLKYASLDAGRKKYYFLSIFLFALSLMSKPMAVTLPVVLLILDSYPLKRLDAKGGTVNALIEKIPYALLSIASSAATVMTNVSKGSLMGLETHPVWTRLLVAAKAYLFYLYKMMIPLKLAPYYPYPDKGEILSWGYIGGMAAFLAITAAVFIYRKRAVASAWAYYLVSLLPVIGIVQLGSYAAANRYTYLPMLGPFILIGVATGSVFLRAGKKGLQAFVIVLMLIAAGVLSTITWGDTGNWKDTVTLWSYQIRLHPDKVPIAYTNRGIEYAKQGQTELALADYNKAVGVDPKYVKAYNNRGVAYASLKRYKEAIADYDIAIRLNPKLAEAYSNRGVAYGMLGDSEKTIRDCGRAIELNPGIPDSYYNRGIAYMDAGDYENAVNDFSTALKLNPWHLKAYNNRGNAYAKLERHELAIKDYGTAIEINAKSFESYFNRANEYLKLNDLRSAVKDFSSVIDINPRVVSAYNNRGNAYNKLGEFEAALRDYKRVIEMEPSNGAAYFNMGILYVKLKDGKKAVENFRIASSLGVKKADDYLRRKRAE
ncbi:MAG: tetratricopeptide repeat protein [Nitrospirae bacterium]|nr:tetratricopeptide repeat protein [Nitrospirota bacterium]